jgi:hypothetical protein
LCKARLDQYLQEASLKLPLRLAVSLLQKSAFLELCLLFYS